MSLIPRCNKDKPISSTTLELNILILISSKLINNDEVKAIASKLKHLPNLQHLHLDFNECWGMCDTGIITLGQQIGHQLHKLKNLIFNCGSCCNTSGKGLTGFTWHIRQNLQQLSLDFSSCDDLEDRELKSFAVQVGEHLFDLRRLDLKFSDCCNIGDEGAEFLLMRIAQNLSKLQHLHLEFDGCGLSKPNAKIVKILATGIGQNLSKLQHLHLNFQRFVTNDGMKLLAKSIRQHLQNLRNLGLDFSNSRDITNGALKALVKNIGQYLLNLRELHLNFLDCPLIGNEGAIEIRMQIRKNLSNLQHLQLTFGCRVNAVLPSNY